MTDGVTNYSQAGSFAEASAMRLMLAALQGGIIKLNSFSADEEDAKKLAEFLGTATTALAKKLLAGKAQD